jgi:PAS domain S-box-containing protein
LYISHNKEGLGTYTLFYVAIFATAWLAGTGPALLACALSIASAFLFLGAPYGFSIEGTTFLRFTLFVCVALFIIAAMRARDEIKRRFKVTLESIADSVVVTNKLGIIEFINTGAAELLSVSKLKAATQPVNKLFNFIHEKTREPLPNPIEIALQENRVIRNEQDSILKTLTGNEFPVDFCSAPVRDARGNSFGAVTVFRNIEQTRQYEKELQMLNAQLQAITETMAAGVTRCSRDMRYLWVSPAYGEWIGYKPEEIIGKPILEVMGKEAFESLKEYFDRVLEGEEVDYEKEIDYRGIAKRWIHAVYKPTFDTNGKADGWVAVVTDITDRKQLEQNLKQSDRRKDEFLAMLAHELRNPLAPIRNAVELMRRLQLEDPKLKRARDIIDSNVTHISRLLDDLLDIARVNSGKIVLEKKNINIETFILQAADNCRAFIESRNQKLHVSVPRNKAEVYGDFTRLTQILTNLLNNAAKFTPYGGEVWLSVSVEKDQLIISVRDTGMGIPAELLPHIFEVFVQGDHSLDHSQGGLGIGLALVRTLVEMHNGTVEVFSKGNDLGSEFIVTFPLVKQVVQDKEEPTTENRKQPYYKILIVDDMLIIAESLAEVLRLDGHDVQTASDGKSALEISKSFHPDILFLDIGLPGMDGYTVAEQLRKEDYMQEAAIIALTGYAEAKDVIRAKQSGFDDHLIKPVDFERLQSLIESFSLKHHHSAIRNP